MAFLDLTAARPTEGYYISEVRTPRPLPVRTFLPTGYEPPLKPELTIDATNTSPQDAAALLLEYLQKQSII